MSLNLNLQRRFLLVGDYPLKYTKNISEQRTVTGGFHDIRTFILCNSLLIARGISYWLLFSHLCYFQLNLVTLSEADSSYLKSSLLASNTLDPTNTLHQVIVREDMWNGSSALSLIWPLRCLLLVKQPVNGIMIVICGETCRERRYRLALCWNEGEQPLNFPSRYVQVI